MGFWNWFRKKDVQHLPEEPRSPEQEEETLPDAVVVTDVLDLHGFFPEQVPEMLQEFIANAERLGLRTLRIIHGKGRSKMKWTVWRELEKYPQVASFRDAPPELGGWGATVVYLREKIKENLKGKRQITGNSAGPIAGSSHRRERR